MRSTNPFAPPTDPPKPSLGAFRLFACAVAGIATGIVAMVLVAFALTASLPSRDDGAFLAGMIAFTYGAPFAAIVGGVAGVGWAIFRPRPIDTIRTGDAAVDARRGYYAVAWFAGAVVGIGGGIALFIVAAGLIIGSNAFYGMMYPRQMQLGAWAVLGCVLVLAGLLWRVTMQSVDRVIRRHRATSAAATERNPKGGSV